MSQRLQVGIVGLPNVGKSTLFNAMVARQQALVANYPFATIEPNVGIVPVPDERLDKLAQVVAGEKIVGEGVGEWSKETDHHVTLPPVVPATVKFVDIAGLVAGAHKGEGLGSKFLANIGEVDLIAHVVRDFSGGDVVVTGVGVVEDRETVTAELILKDLETVQSQSEKPRVKNVDAKFELVLDKLRKGFDEGKRAVEILSAVELDEVRELFLLTAKPEIVVVNVDEVKLQGAGQADLAGVYASEFGVEVDSVVVVSAKVEGEIALLSSGDARMFMDDLGLEESGLERLVKTAYDRLGLISFLTAGDKEVRAWTIRAGMVAIEAAGVIHTDFSNNFIKAEVVGFGDFVQSGGWKKCRDLGKVRLEGREYVMQDGDVVEFKIGA